MILPDRIPSFFSKFIVKKIFFFFFIDLDTCQYCMLSYLQMKNIKIPKMTATNPSVSGTSTPTTAAAICPSTLSLLLSRTEVVESGVEVFDE